MKGRLKHMSFSKKKKKQSSDNGQVWSSYSDMFTTMAIIFLVMFVFAMIKVGVSTIERISQQKAHEKELEGYIPEKAQIESQNRLETINESIEQVGEYREIIDQKVIELNQLVKKLESNKDVMSDIVSEQAKKEAILEKVREELQKKKTELAQESQ